MFEELCKQLETLEGEELARYWLSKLNPHDQEFRAMYLELPTELREKLYHTMRQCIDIWSTAPNKTLICLECRENDIDTDMILDPDPVAKTRWRCPKCNAKY